MACDGLAGYDDASSEGSSSTGSPVHRAVCFAADAPYLWPTAVAADDDGGPHVNDTATLLAPSPFLYGGGCPPPAVAPPVPIQFEIASLYEDLGRRRSQNSKDNSASAQVTKPSASAPRWPQEGHR
jgi:hypothetical protein